MKTKKTPKQIAALICIVLLVLLYVADLAVALLHFPGADRLFAACLTATIGLPILLWIYIWCYGRLSDRRKEADPKAQIEAAQKDADADARIEAAQKDAGAEARTDTVQKDTGAGNDLPYGR